MAELPEVPEGWELPLTAKCGAGYRGCQGRGTLRIDPYDEDINNHKVYRYLCDHCEEQSALDV